VRLLGNTTPLRSVPRGSVSDGDPLPWKFTQYGATGADPKPRGQPKRSGCGVAPISASKPMPVPMAELFRKVALATPLFDKTRFDGIDLNVGAAGQNNGMV